MPIYETQADRDNEAAVIAAVCKAWSCTAVRSPHIGGTDTYLDYKDKRVAHAEVKCRTTHSTAYRDYMIDAAKIRGSLERARLAHCLCLLIVRFEDGIFWTRIDEATVANHNCRMGGRKDRNDKHDIELCCFIPMANFKPLKPNKNS